MAISDYIVYSLFNYCILPSFFDFRDKRYILGLTFNFQSYSFLKGFITLFEPNLTTMTDSTFHALCQVIIYVLDDPQKKKIVKKMISNKEKYDALVLTYISNFLYIHIDPCSRDKATF